MYVIIDKYFYLHQQSSANTHRDKNLLRKNFITFKVKLKNKLKTKHTINKMYHTIKIYKK